MNLVIVESPTKAKTISKFLGPNYKVESSYGHIRDLPKSKLGIDIENNFEPQYIIPVKARKTVKQLKGAAKKSESVILATDEDREGEAIAWHLKQALGLEGEKTERIVFHEITKAAIDKALQHPRSIDDKLVNAQQARRVLDRLVGYKLSPFLWKKIMGGLSAGRVQSVAVRLIMDRENEIRNFKTEEYWSISAILQKLRISNKGTSDVPNINDVNIRTSEVQNIEAILAKIDDKTLDKFDVKNKEQAEKIASELKSCGFNVAAVEKKEVNKNSPPPFITSTLQQEAVKKFGYSSKKTMFIAQRLYERGLITYMRTDSVNLSQEALGAVKDWLIKNFGDQYASAAPRVFTGKSRLAQEAHEAIRPTDVNFLADVLEDESEKKLYRLIWQRFVASQMPAAKISMTSVEIFAEPRTLNIEHQTYTLRASGQQIIFDGYLKVWPQKFSEKDLPELREGETLEMKDILPQQHFTEPPPRYSEASLIKSLEEHGIGRPSTYAPIISVIQFRNYVKKEKSRFFPTEIGEMVNKVLTEHFPKIVDIDFTAKMEEQLDHVASGEEKWQQLIGEFYGPFAKNLEEKYAEVRKTVVEEKTDQVCEKCGKPMVIKFGRFGKFLACSGFPDCKNTKQLAKEPPKEIGMVCPKCGQGQVVERRVSKGRARGKFFWGCSRYPDCDYASWTNPLKPAEKTEELVE